MMENKYVFIKKYVSKHIALQETKNSHVFDKSGAQENLKCHMNKVDLDES